MKRISRRYALARAEEARAEWLKRFPQGFEERTLGDELELAAYVDELPADVAEFAVADVEPGWEDRWREFHHGGVVGQLWVGPPWETPVANLLSVVIDPGRAFGTGAHPTTRLCLELLQALPAGSLVDVGCGSGVLAIAAAKLGHAPVTAVDIDGAAVEATQRNASRNAVEIRARVADATAGRVLHADVAVANIALGAVEAVARNLDAGAVITSGYLVRERPELAGFRHAERRTAADWAADRWERE